MSIVMSINVNSGCLETKIRATPYKNIYKSREVLFVPQKNAACCIGGQNKKELMEDKKKIPFRISLCVSSQGLEPWTH